MKIVKACLAICSTALALPASADLFFSEYIEGSSNNKALEIYNDTGGDVVLNEYRIRITFNGGTFVSTIPLGGTLAADDVYVVADDGADPAILAEADLTPSSSFFNGDDAIELLNGEIVVDSIGQVGFDPGSAWNNNGVSTQNDTIRRKPGITAGDTNPGNAFDPSVEWESFGNNTFAGLGSFGDVMPPPPPVFARISAVQGSGDSSPLAGAMVTIEGIVVGDFQNNGGADSGDLSGFYVQEEDIDADGDASTSEGIFVFDGGGTVDVEVGDRVQVSGEAKEFSGLTEIDADQVDVLSSGEPLPAETLLMLPLADVGQLEAFEGMRVRFPQDLVISEYFNFDRFGEIVLALPLPGETRPMTPTAVELPGSTEYLARLDANQRSRITLDDGRTESNPDPARHPNGAVFDLGNRFRGGDLVQDVSGIMDDRFGVYRVQPTAGANHIIVNPRPELPPFIDADIRIASFNVLNYFTTLDESGNLCGPNLLGCRGADNAEEFERQRTKIIAAMARIDADIFGLIEIENNATAAVDDLVDGLNSVAGAGTFDKIDTGVIGGDAIKVAFIYKPARVAPLGDYAVLDSSVDPRFIDTKNRPALAVTFAETSGSGLVTVAVNHFKSKGSPCDDVGDPDQLDGQGRCNGTRTLAAQALVDWLETDPTGSGNGNILVIGDLNAYDKEDPIAALTSAGYTDLLLRDEGELGYTYVFSGQFGYLDYALANEALLAKIIAARSWHINADEPDILDYDTSFKRDAQDFLYEPNPFRSSDHDPVIVGLDFSVAIGDLTAFIDAAAASGELVGTGRANQQQRRLNRLAGLVELAGGFEQRGISRVSCVLLGSAQHQSDGDPRPRDLVSGPAAATLSALIADYRAENCH